MALKIFGTDPETQPKPRESFADDIVGKFRSGHQINGQPSALDAWRVTSGDPDVVNAVHALLGGDAPQEWEAKGEDNLEVFTAASSVNIILEGEKALRQRMILWGRNGKPISISDGEFLEDGTPDPDAHLTFEERKRKGQDGVGAVPSIEITFRLADNPDLGLFRFTTGSWSMARDLATDGTEERLAAVEGPAKATLTLTEVSFVAKNGPRKGQNVSYTKPTLKIKGAA